MSGEAKAPKRQLYYITCQVRIHASLVIVSKMNSVFSLLLLITVYVCWFVLQEAFCSDANAGRGFSINALISHWPKLRARS